MALSAARILWRELLNRPYGRLIRQSTVPSRQFKSLFPLKNFSAILNINKFRYCSKESAKWVTLIFERHDGTQLKRKGKVGETLQLLIGQNNPDFPGYGACDGTISCSTCHVILSKEDFERLPKPDDEEEDTLELSPGLTETSRLGCCIELTADMNGMVIKLPEEVKDLRETD